MEMTEEGTFEVRQAKKNIMKLVSSKLYLYIIIKKCVINTYN